MNDAEKLKGILASKGYKFTKVRGKVYSALLATRRPLTNTELIRSIDGIDKVSVYRTIALFESLNIVHRIWNGFKSNIELAEEYSPHHHHFTCLICQKVLSFKDAKIEENLNALSTKLNIKITQHLIEISGHCEKCLK